MNVPLAMSAQVLRAFEQVPDLYVILSPDLVVLTVSDTFLKVVEQNRDQLVGRPITDVFAENPLFRQQDFLRCLIPSLQQVLQTKQPHCTDVQRCHLRLLDKEEIFIEKYWRFLNTPVLDEQDEIQYIIHKVEDVTDKVETEAKLKEEFLHLKDAQTIGRIGSFERLWNAEEITCSDEWYRLHGLEPQSEVMTLNKMLDFIHPDDRQQTREAIMRSRKTGEPFHLIQHIIRADGEKRSIQRRAMILKDASGNPYKIYGTVQDITEQLEAKKKVAENEALLRATEEAAQTGSYELEVATMQIQFSDGMFQLFGEQPHSFVPSLKFIDSHTVPEDVSVIKARIDLAIQDRKPYQYIRRVYRKDGDLRALQAKGKVICDVAGKVVKLIGLVQDITEQLKAEQELRESKLFVEQIVEATPDFIMILNVITDKVEFVNRNAYQGNEERYRETATSNLEGLLKRAHPEDKELVRAFVDSFRSTASNDVQTLDYRVVIGEKVVWYQTRGKVFKRNEKRVPTHIINIVQDISKIKQLEEENLHIKLNQQKTLLLGILQAQEEERKRISESLHNGVGQILYATMLNLERVKEQNAQDDKALKTTHELLYKAINETRQVSHELVPLLLQEFGLEEALLDLSKRYENSALYVRCQVKGLQERLDAYLEVALYRITQELVNNVIKHAEATMAFVQLTKTETNILLEVRDNGKGFSYNNELSNGIGLRMIQDRIKLLNGTFLITKPKAGKGTLISIRIPV